MTRQQQFQHLIQQPCFRYIDQQIFQLRNGRGRRRFDLHTELGRQPHCAQHTHRVFAITHRRIADHTQSIGAYIFIAMVIVINGLRGGIVEHGIGGKVTARGILLLIAKFVVTQQASMLVDFSFIMLNGTAKSRHFNRIRTKHYMHQAKASPDDT